MAEQSTNKQTQGSSRPGPEPSTTRGIKWTVEEENWAVTNTMRDVNMNWLTANFPGQTRSAHAITGHLSDMRLKSRLSRSWRSRNWSNELPYTITEDVEIMQWHVWGREYIDPEIFVANDRAGGAIIARADYLCQDEDLVSRVEDVEEKVRIALLERDAIEHDSEVTQDPVSLRHLAIEYRHRENQGIQDIRDAIAISLASRH